MGRASIDDDGIAVDHDSGCTAAIRYHALHQFHRAQGPIDAPSSAKSPAFTYSEKHDRVKHKNMIILCTSNLKLSMIK